MTDRYRKKPVEVRAWKIGFDGQEPDWVREAFDGERIDWCPAGEGLYINTLEGHMKAGIGDMLIEGVKGELYGCRADIFAATYEPVAQQEALEGTITLEQAESHAHICGKLAEEHKSDPVLFAALTDAAAIIRDLLRDRLSASAAGAGQAGQPTYSELLAQRDELAKALRGMLNIVDDSCGVAGYHLNGNVADWGEFEEVDAAGAALSRIKGETTLAASHLPAGWRIEAHEDEALLRQALEALERGAWNNLLAKDAVDTVIALRERLGEKA